MDGVSGAVNSAGANFLNPFHGNPDQPFRAINVVSGLIAGSVTVILWKQPRGGIFDLYEIVPGFAACLLLAVLVSLLDTPNNPEVEAEYEAYEKLGD
ncbi:MAG: hypothetical protein LBF83_04195 [Spirochaetaceae bacterium]|jgi:sodium/proline symporter|nr:hypothetical protein [Spirochaetaceae bacterium]